MGKYLTKEDKSYILGLIHAGVTYREIVRLFLLRFDRTLSLGTITRIKSPLIGCTGKKGPKKKTTRAQDIICLEVVEENRWQSWSRIAQLLRTRRIFISARTLRRRMKAIGISSYVANKKPFISEVQAQQRLAFAQRYIDMPDEFFRNWLFVDESTVSCLVMT